MNQTVLLALVLALVVFEASRPANPSMSFLKSLGKSLKFYSKGLVALNLLLLSATYGVLCSIVYGVQGKRDLAQWSTAQFYYKIFSKVMRIRVDVNRPDLLAQLPAIIIGNHQSEMDILLLGRLFPPKCVVTAKQSLKYLPFLGWFMAASGTFFLDRGNSKQSRDTLNAALQTLKSKGGGLWIFPEGTRSKATKPTLLPLKKGAFHLAVQGQLPIIPCVISNTSDIYSMKLKNFETGTIHVQVLDPIDTTGLTADDVAKLTLDTEKKMRAAVESGGYSTLDSGDTPQWPSSDSSPVQASSSTSESAPLLDQKK